MIFHNLELLIIIFIADHVNDYQTIRIEQVGSSGIYTKIIDLETWQKQFNYDLNSQISPLIIKTYSVINYIDANRYSNGSFEKDKSNWHSWSTYNNFNISWDKSGILDEGCLKLTSSGSSISGDGKFLCYSDFGEAFAGESYILKFSMVSSHPDKKVKIVMRRGNDPYISIAEEQYILVTQDRKEYELLITPTSNEPVARIDFEIEESDDSFWIDNVELYSANIKKNNVDDCIKFLFNSNNEILTINDKVSYVDVKGVKYAGSIDLLPYTSKILMVDPNPSASPVIPTYLSSVIQSDTPSKLEMTYNLTLDNIVPPTSAFSVQVNSSSISISSVSISGTKVLLTLASPVAYGNTVTIAYTKPSANPIQTSAGGQAATFTSQSVTNRVAAPPAPAVPVFSGATIENVAPSVIVLTYSLPLTNVTPAVSAFSVMVNSAPRGVSSITISGAQVSLTLSSPVAYGNSVTVAYNTPSSNPLQTSAGGLAVSISAQTASNRVDAVATPPVIVTPPVVVPNTPPVAVVNYITGTYSGFVGELNATGSYDADKDNLSYTWEIANNISVSSTNSSVIEFLAPIVETKQTFAFTLTVSDGKTTHSKTIPVEVLPYQPELETAEVIAVEAGDFQTPNLPDNAVDGNFGTMWSAIGSDQWIILELKYSFNIQHIKVGFEPGQKKESYFDVLGSNDKKYWEPVLTKSKSCDFSGDMQVFEFPPSKSEKEYRFIKLVGQGNSQDNWNYISEFRIFGYKHDFQSYYENLAVKIYPNPATELVNIKIDEPELSFDFIRIINLSGKTVYYDNKLENGTREFKIPIDFSNGFYVIQLGIKDLTLFTNKLVVNN